MSAQVTADSLKNLKVFSAVPKDELQQVAELCEEVQIPAGSVLFRQNEEASDVYVIVDGEVSLVVCDAISACRQIGVARAGELVGWSSVLERRLLTDMACANTAVTALKIDGSALLDYCQSHTKFGFELMRMTALTIAERLSGTRNQLMEVHGTHLPEVRLESD
ncbi:Crp/Fnr family transcriptional regulator [Posidoniimonas polymericola]|nr:Crp/Fnr family transcriptional regulator [Posidoniimonas polymericola]